MVTAAAAALDLSRLPAWLAPQIGASALHIERAERLGGGAVQENWGIDVAVTDGTRQGAHGWVLRIDGHSRLSVSLDRATEFAVLQTAYACGVAVAEPIVRCADASVIGRTFLIQRRAAGSAQGRKLVRDRALPTYGDRLAERLGEELARIHAIVPPLSALSVLPVPMLPPARAEVAKFRAALDQASVPRPALEYVLAWLDAHAPVTRRLGLVHGDFRTGNYMVEDGSLTAVLDWEFAHWGDANEDIGWFMARCWRFGGDDRHAGGIGARQAFYRGYERAAGHAIDPAAIAYWEIMAAAKWAAIAVLQGDRFRTGGETSIELALTGLMAPEMELDALDGILALQAKAAGGRI